MRVEPTNQLRTQAPVKWTRSTPCPPDPHVQMTLKIESQSHQVSPFRHIYNANYYLLDDDDGSRKRCDFVWSPIRLIRTTEEISTCNRATAEKIRYNFGLLYPELVGRELKVENLIAKEMQKYLQRVESNTQMTKMTKCKIGMKYNATCPTIVNSFLKCKWGDIDDTGNFCFQCGAINLLEDLEERCNIIMNDKPVRDGKLHQT